MIQPRPTALILLALGASLLSIPAARAWEVVGGAGLPVFAAGAAPASAAAPSSGFGVTPAGASGYDFRVGRNLLVGVETQTGFAAVPFGFSSGLDASRTTMKFGYDLGRFKPFVMSSFAETRPAFNANAFSGLGAPPGVASPFAPGSTRISTVGAGFDYAITDKLSLGVSVTASQASSGWQR